MMWPFVKDLKLLPMLAAEAEFFGKAEITKVTHTFERIVHRAGTSAYKGNVLTSERLNLIRVLVNKKFMATHVMMSVGNFRDFEALASYEMDEEDWERFLLRDATIFFLIVLQETLVCYRNSFHISELIGEALETPRSSRLVDVFSKFFDNSTQKFIEEFSYCVLFYVAICQTSKDQWKQWNSYKELPEGVAEILSMDSSATEDLRLRAAVINRLTLTNCINKIFLMKKIATLALTDQEEMRRRFEFTLCVLEPDEIDHHRSLIRTLAACADDSHGERIKSWLEQKAHYVSGLDDIDWEDDGQWESVDEDEETIVNPSNIICWNMVANKITQRRFTEAINFIEKLDTSRYTEDEKGVHDMIWGYAASQSNDRDLLKRSRRILVEVAKSRPIANYWLAEMSVRLSAYAEASRFLEDARFDPVGIPCTQTYLRPFSEADYEMRIEQLRNILRTPPKPEHTCCRQNCDSKGIYESSLGFNGLAQMICGSDCVLTFHTDCWKIVLQQFLRVENKHGLGSACYTPDCPGRIVLVKLFNSKMQSTKEYRWTALENASSPSPMNVDDDIFEALRVTIHQMKGQMSKSDIVSLCEDFTNGDHNVISSFVESCLEDDQGPHPDWTKAQWLLALQSHFEGDSNSLNIDEINSLLKTWVITERIEADDIDSIEKQYAQAESELSDLLNEEAVLRNRLLESRVCQADDSSTRLQHEVEEIELKLTQAEGAEEAVKTLERNLDLKKGLLVSFAEQLKQTQEQLSEIEARLSEEGLKHQNLQDERVSLLRIVKQNALDSRASVRRALMELNETRYAIDSANLQMVERAVQRNLRKAETQRDPEVKRLNSEARREHFKFLNEVVIDLRKLEEKTKAMTVEIQNGRMDSADVQQRRDQLEDLLKRYADLPNIYITKKKPTLREVAESLH